MKFEIDIEKVMSPQVRTRIAKQAIYDGIKRTLEDFRWDKDFVVELLKMRMKSDDLDELERKIKEELKSPVKYLLASPEFMKLINGVVEDNREAIKEAIAKEVKEGKYNHVVSELIGASLKQSLFYRGNK